MAYDDRVHERITHFTEDLLTEVLEEADKAGYWPRVVPSSEIDDAELCEWILGHWKAYQELEDSPHSWHDFMLYLAQTTLYSATLGRLNEVWGAVHSQPPAPTD